MDLAIRTRRVAAQAGVTVSGARRFVGCVNDTELDTGPSPQAFTPVTRNVLSGLQA